MYVLSSYLSPVIEILIILPEVILYKDKQIYMI